MYYFGTVSSYVQKAALLHMARQKIATPYGMTQKSKSDALREAEQQAIAQRTETIKNKLKAGKKLTTQELQFLLKHAPELYDKAVKIAKEREEYQKKLKKCRSKEEAQRMHLQKTQALAAEAGAVSKSSMPKGEKLDAMETISMRAMALTDEYRSYVNSERYKRLPEKADQEKDNEDEIKAEDTRIKNEVRAMEEEALRKKQQEEADAQAALSAQPDRESPPVGNAQDISPAPGAEKTRQQAAPAPVTRHDRAIEAYRRHAKRR